MKEINNQEVKITYILREKSKDEADFLNKKKELLNKDKSTWEKLITSYHKTYEEFFSNETKWFQTELDPHKFNLVNNIFNSLCGEKNRLGISFNEMIKKYEDKNLPISDINKIDKIKKTLTINPKVIMITTNLKTISIFDGWHTSIAFTIENKKIPCFIGLNKDFSALRIKN